MRVRFLLGPAGSGKTYRCLQEIRTALIRDPRGAPLIFLAPKQATYQIERQLLTDPSLAGYSRLHILSFERLASFVLEHAGIPYPDLLEEEGRVMVLRALLTAHANELRLFRASSRLPGFARQLSQVLRELQQHHCSAAALQDLADKVGPLNRLDDKLHDLAFLLQRYQEWLRDRGLRDADELLDFARDILLTRPSSAADETADTNASTAPWLQGLWMDGFAQMTPQERHLLQAIAPHCQELTLAFCLDEVPVTTPPWYSPWTLLAQTYHQCREDLTALPQADVFTEILPWDPERQRFARQPVLQQLERSWSRPNPMPAVAQQDNPSTSSTTDPCPPPVLVVQCAQPEAEAAMAAREIRRHVRRGGRYRDIAVQMRSLESYHAPIRRAFGRYAIPYYIDRRENVSHHPLVELTRNALRTVTYGWRHDDWFGALKSGLVGLDEDEVDWLENEALARGWEGAAWLRPLPGPSSRDPASRSEKLRQHLTRPFARLTQDVAHHPNGRELAAAIRRFWQTWRVDQTLASWSSGGTAETAVGGSELHAETRPIHTTVWEQMQQWLDNVALAFPAESLPLADWLPILEAGWSGLTVGVVPPVLDQVLVGTIDRSRQPDLKVAISLGWNETIFPAPPPSPLILTESDRNRLDDAGSRVGLKARLHLGHERFYGYIACTRARERLVVGYSLRDASGKQLNPSPFIKHILKSAPNTVAETFSDPAPWWQAEHPAELIAPWLQFSALPENARPTFWSALAEHATLAPILQRLRQLQSEPVAEPLAPATAEALYGSPLTTSVSRIEDFASCPFRFFVRSGLRVEERERFELDLRQQGLFQHEVLAQFHQSLTEEGLRWRDLSPAQAQERIRDIADRLAPSFGHGVLMANGRNRFLASRDILALQQFIGVVVDWMKQYAFDPVVVERGFGLPEDDSLPPWELSLNDKHRLRFRGRIDRIDLWWDRENREAWCVVMDYKSGHRKVDRTLMRHGVQQQLPAYLNVLRHLPAPPDFLRGSQLKPAGVFYVPLRGRYVSGQHREEVLEDPTQSMKSAFTHQGLADAEARSLLDQRRDVLRGDQFPYRLKTNGELYSNSATFLPAGEFLELLDTQKNWLIQAGTRIYQGETAVDPWKKGNQTACDTCAFQSVCRIDPWTHAYRLL